MSALFGAGGTSHAGESVTARSALEVPAVSAAVSFIAGQIASLPVQLYRRKGLGRVKAEKEGLYRIVHDVVNNEGLTSFQWLNQTIRSLILKGRAVTFVERDLTGRIVAMWPLDLDQLTIQRVGHRKEYVYTFHESLRTVTYGANEVLDFVLMPCGDGISHENPVHLNRHTIGLALAADRYASGLFFHGGMPPLQLLQTGGDEIEAASTRAQEMAANGLHSVLKKMAAERKMILPMEKGFKLDKIGLNPAELQMLELKKYLVIEIARMFNLPPVFLQDLSNGTYSNTEQQGMMLVKHCLMPLVKLIEQEMNAKLTTKSLFIEINMDGLLRGDFATRMTGHATAINNAIMTPNEVRSLESLPPMEGGDKLRIQGANVAIEDQAALAKAATETNQPNQEEDPDEPADDDNDD